MGWTPATNHPYVTPELITPATLNTYIQANLTFLYGGASWTVPSFANSWVDLGTGGPVGYRAVGNQVLLRGSIKTGTLNLAAFTLPSGFRPAATVTFIVLSNGAAGYLTVTAAGVVTPVSGSNTAFSLDGVTFDVLP